MKVDTKSPSLAALAERWPSAWVSRNEVKEFSGGLLNPKTLANYDSAGIGIKNRFRVGRLVVYRVSDLVEWLQERFEPIQDKAK